jgi:hypothetical protein
MAVAAACSESGFVCAVAVEFHAKTQRNAKAQKRFAFFAYLR